MSIFPAQRLADPVTVDQHITELDGPPTAYFEIPLEYWATANGELEPAGHPESQRLVQRVEYKSFGVPTLEIANDLVAAVRAELRKLGGGYIWWRKRPAMESYDGGKTKWRLRLATSPELPWEWWVHLGDLAGNTSSDRTAPGGKNGRRI